MTETVTNTAAAAADAGRICVACVGDGTDPATRQMCLRCCGTGLDPDPLAPAAAYLDLAARVAELAARVDEIEASRDRRRQIAEILATAGLPDPPPERARRDRDRHGLRALDGGKPNDSPAGRAHAPRAMTPAGVTHNGQHPAERSTP